MKTKVTTKQISLKKDVILLKTLSIAFIIALTILSLIF
jgi:hypothetical protein